MARFDAVNASDLSPREKQSLRLQIARGTEEVCRAASPPAALAASGGAEEGEDAVGREGSPIDTSSAVPLDTSHRALMGRFDLGASPLGKFRDHHSLGATNGSHFSPHSGAGRFSSPPYADANSTEQPTLALLSRRGISHAAPGGSLRGASLAPSAFHNVSTNPFDPTWEPVAGGTKAYLPDGSLVDIA